MFRKVNAYKEKVDWLLPRTRGGNKEGVLMISFWSDRNALELDCSVAWQHSELLKNH